MGMAWNEEEAAGLKSFNTLTPLDIHNREFKRSFRGYDEDEVDGFLDLVVAEFERIMRDNEELRALKTDLEARVQHYKGLEETLKNSIVLAQKTADQVKEVAMQEGENIKQKAELEAEAIRRKAQEDMKETFKELEEARGRLLRFKAEMKVYLSSQLEVMENGSEGILERLGKAL